MNKEETNQYKISVPLLNAEELVKIDNYYNEIVDEFVKVSVKKRDDVIKQRIMMNLRKENQQLKETLKETTHCFDKEEYKRLQQENQQLKGAIQTYDILLKANVEENQQLKKELEYTIGIVEHNRIINEHILKERELQIQISVREEEYRKLEHNWNELKKGLQSTFDFDYGVLSKDYLECVQDVLDKMQELERSLSDVED